MSSSLDVDRELNELYQVPLSEFVKARNALAKKLGETGDSESAAAVKALAKPSVSAWAVNQLYWKDRGIFDELISAAEHLREVHAESLSKGTRDAEKRLSDALRHARGATRGLLSRNDLSTSETVLRRIDGSLEAIASLGGRHTVDGRLTKDVPQPGFSVLDGIAEAPLSGSAERVDPQPSDSAGSRAEDPKTQPDEIARELARKTLLERERELEGARDELRMAEAAVRESARRLEATRRQLENDQAALASAETRVETARARLAERATRVDSARVALEKLSEERG